MKNLNKIKNKFIQADNETYFETKLIVTYMCTLTQLFQRAILDAEIPCIRLPQNKQMYKKSDVLAWLEKNKQEFNLNFEYTKTKSQSKTEHWLGEWTKQRASKIYKGNQK